MHDILSALNILDPNGGSVSESGLFDTIFEDATPHSNVGNFSCTELTDLTHLNEDIWFAEQPTTDVTGPTSSRRTSATDATASSNSCNTQPINVASSSSRDTNQALQPRPSVTLNPELTHLPDENGPAEQIAPCFRTLADGAWEHPLPLPDISGWLSSFWGAIR